MLFKDQKTSLTSLTSLILVIFSAFALLASFVLSIDKVKLLENPDAQLVCSVNLVVNCASVMKTEQASVFGFTNSFFGIAAFAALLALAVAIAAGVRLPNWLLKAMQVGVAFGWGFALWLFFQSVYVIQILCPWCLVVTTSTTILFFALLRYNLQRGALGLDNKTHKAVNKWLEQKYDVMLTIAILVGLTALIFVKFGNSLFM